MLEVFVIHQEEYIFIKHLLSVHPSQVLSSSVARVCFKSNENVFMKSSQRGVLDFTGFEFEWLCLGKWIETISDCRCWITDVCPSKKKS